MLNKLACEAGLHWWSIPATNSKAGMDTDRNIFAFLNQNFEGRRTYKATAVYNLDETDSMHAERLKWMARPDIVKPKTTTE